MIDNRCTFFISGDWLHCCIAHDYACADAKGKINENQIRIRADKQLARCVATIDGIWHWPIAALMFIGVRIFWYLK